MKPSLARGRAWLRKQGSLAVPLVVVVAATAGALDWGRRTAAQSRAPRYYCQDLGTLGGPHAGGAGLNNLGHVVGESMVAGGSAVHAFLHDGERLIDLGGQPGWANSWAQGI